MMKIELVKAEISDAERLLEIQKSCFIPHLERYQDYATSPATISLNKIQRQIQKDNFYKILADDLWVGSINIKKLDNEGNYMLHIINVLPAYQGRGIGQQAIKLIEEIFSDAKSWRLETLEDMAGNRHLYEKMGYQLTGRTEKINDKLTLVFYEKTIF